MPSNPPVPAAAHHRQRLIYTPPRIILQYGYCIPARALPSPPLFRILYTFLNSLSYHHDPPTPNVYLFRLLIDLDRHRIPSPRHK
jgi:hypothetical protein